jgi:hypothetical protein
MLDADFPGFAAIRSSALGMQSTDGGYGGRDPRLQELSVALANYGGGVAPAGTVETLGLGDWIKTAGTWAGKAKSTWDTVSGIGKSLGLFENTSDLEMQFLGAFLESQVDDLIRKLNGYVQQYSNLVECVPLVTQTVQLATAKEYVKALSKGYEAYNCIRSKL